MNAYVLAAAFAAGLLCGAGAVHLQWRADVAQIRAAASEAQVVAVGRAIAQAQAQADEDAQLLAEAAQAETQIVTQTRTVVRRVVEHVQTDPVYRDCRVDAGGLCLAQAAYDGSDPAACADGGNGVGARTAAARGRGGRAPAVDGSAADDLHRDGGRMAPVHAPPAGAGRLDPRGR